jgi:hypothetical protein
MSDVDIIITKLHKTCKFLYFLKTFKLHKCNNDRPYYGILIKMGLNTHFCLPNRWVSKASYVHRRRYQTNTSWSIALLAWKVWRATSSVLAYLSIMTMLSPGNPCRRKRLITVDLIVLTGLDQLLLILQTFTQATLTKPFPSISVPFIVYW